MVDYKSMYSLKIQIHPRIYKENPSENWGDSWNSKIQENNIIEIKEKEAKKKLLDDILNAKNEEEGKKILEIFNTWKDDYEKVNIVVDDLFDDSWKPQPRSNEVEEEIRYNLGIHDNPPEYIEKKTNLVTWKIYDAIMWAQNSNEAIVILNTYKNIYITGEFSKLIVNLSTLSYNLKDLFDTSWNPIWRDKENLKRIKYSLWLKDRNIEAFRNNDSIENTFGWLAKELTELITRRASEYEFVKLRSYYEENAPEYFKKKALTMIQVALNIFINNPENNQIKPNTGLLQGELKNSINLANSRWNNNMSSVPVETPSIKSNWLKTELIYYTLLNSIEKNPGDDNWALGNQAAMTEYSELKPEQKEALSVYSPKMMYGMILKRFAIETTTWDNTKPEDIIKELKDILYQADGAFWIKKNGAIMKLYDKLFTKSLAFMKSGILDHPDGPKIIQELAAAADGKSTNIAEWTNESYQAFEEFEKSLWVAPGGFWVEKDWKLKFHTIYEISNSIEQWNKLTEGAVMAIRGYMNSWAPNEIGNNFGKLFKNWEEQLIFAQYYNNLDKDKKSEIIPIERQWEFEKYLTQNNLIAGINTSTREVKLENINISQGFKDFLKQNKDTYETIESIPMNADNTPNIPLLMSRLLKPNSTIEACAKLQKAMLSEMNTILANKIRKIDTQKNTILSQLQGLGQKINNDTSIADIFKILGWKENYGSLQDIKFGQLDSLDQISKDRLGEIMNSLNSITPTVENKAIHTGLISLIQEKLKLKSLQHIQQSIQNANPKDLATATTRWPDEVGKIIDGGAKIVQANREITLNDKNIINTLKKIDPSFLSKYWLPTDPQAYQDGTIRDSLKKVISQLADDVPEKEKLKDILHLIELNDTYKTDTIRIVKQFQSSWYTETLKSSIKEIQFLNNIPPTKLAEYAQNIATSIYPENPAIQLKNDLAKMPTGTEISLIKYYSNSDIWNGMRSSISIEDCSFIKTGGNSGTVNFPSYMGIPSMKWVPIEGIESFLSQADLFVRLWFRSLILAMWEINTEVSKKYWKWTNYLDGSFDSYELRRTSTFLCEMIGIELTGSEAIPDITNKINARYSSDGDIRKKLKEMEILTEEWNFRKYQFQEIAKAMNKKTA